jgi:hypothetical protein
VSVLCPRAVDESDNIADCLLHRPWGWPCMPVGGCVSVVTGPAQPRASTISPSSRPYSVNS